MEDLDEFNRRVVDPIEVLREISGGHIEESG
jgi:hypothetical protein